MKIGIDARAAIWYRGTGIGTYTYQLIRNLHTLIPPDTLRFFWPGDEYQNLDITNDEIFNSIEQSKDKFWEEIHLPTRLLDEGIDLYHVPQNGIGLPVTKSCHLVVTIHDLIPYIYPETVGKGYLKLFLEQMPHIMQSSDHIITVSECSRQDIIEIFDIPPEKITVTYEAPEPIYRPMDKENCRTFLTTKYGINFPYILYLGGFSPRKNLKTLISAYQILIKDLGTAHKLLFVGKRSREFDELNILVNALGLDEHILFPGFIPVNELSYFYNAAEVFVYPSLYEGFGLPPLEAMACGTPTIAANTSSIPEVVESGGLLFNPHKPAELANLLAQLLTNQEMREGYAQKGLQQAAKFTWPKLAEETLDVYKNIMSSR